MGEFEYEFVNLDMSQCRYPAMRDGMFLEHFYIGPCPCANHRAERWRDGIAKLMREAGMQRPRFVPCVGCGMSPGRGLVANVWPESPGDPLDGELPGEWRDMLARAMTLTRGRGLLPEAHEACFDHIEEM